MRRSVNAEFWTGKRVLLTGHTGFKGSWLSLWLQNMAVTLRGVSLSRLHVPLCSTLPKSVQKWNNHTADIRDLSVMRRHVKEFSPDILIHMAAQPLVRLSYQEPMATFETNIMGTLNVLEAARSGKNLRRLLTSPQINVMKTASGFGAIVRTSQWEGVTHILAAKVASNY